MAAPKPKTNAERIELVADVLLDETARCVADMAVGSMDFEEVQKEIQRIVPRVVASLIITRDALYAAVQPATDTPEQKEEVNATPTTAAMPAAKKRGRPRKSK